MILVTGATGPVGSQVLAKLVDAGKPVRALTRDPKAARLKDTVELAQGDLGKPETLREAVDGVDRIFVVMPTFSVPEAQEYDGNLVSAAKAAGVKQIVRMSVIAAGDDSADDPHTTYHRQGEKVVRESGLAWTFLRPGQFMTNALSWADTIQSGGFVREPYADVKQAPIDPQDVAASGVALLQSSPDEHAGQVYPLSGPEALSIEEQTAILAEVLGREIRTINVPPDVARAEWLNEGYPQGMVDGIMRHMADETGIHGKVFSSVADLTGSPARTFAQWARDNVDAFS